MASIAIAEKSKKTPKQPHPQEREGTIPVFTVLKNNAILKNIFILDNNNNDHNEHTLLVGRHPDCNIVLTHPSISRFHLQIRSNPSSRTLSLVDLSSVHGTWVNGRKLEPGESVHLNQGDTFTLGVSTRVYRLRWVPVTLALDSENPFVSELDVVEEEQAQEQEVEIVKDVSFCTGGIEETQLVDLIPECNNSFLLDENLELTGGKEIPSPEDIASFCCDEERKSQSKDGTFGVLNGPFGPETSYFPTNSNGENKLCGRQNQVLAPPYLQSVDEVDNTQKIQACPEVEMPGETNLFCTLREYLTEKICLPVVEAVQGTKMLQFQGPLDTSTAQLPPSKQEASFKECSTSLANIDPASFDDKGASAVAVVPKELEFGFTLRGNDKIEDILTSGASSFNSENTCLLVGEVIPDSKFQQIQIVEEVSLDSLSDGENQDKCNEDEEYKSKLKYQNAKSCHEEWNSVDEIVEDIGEKCTYVKNMDPASFDENGGAAAVLGIPKDSDFGCKLRDKDRIEDILTTGARVFHSENTSLLVEEAIPVTKFPQMKIVEEVAVDSISDVEKQDKCGEQFKSQLKAYVNAKSCHEQGNSLDEIVEDTGNNCTSSICPVSSRVESLNSSVPKEAILKNTKDKENQTLQSLIGVAGCSEMKILESQATENAKYCHEQGNPQDETVEDIGNKSTSSICPVSLRVESLNSSVPKEAILKNTNEKENQTLQSLIGVAGCSEMKILESQATENAKYCHEQGNPQDETVEDIGNKCTGSICPISLLVESVNSPAPQEADLKITNKKENLTPQSLIDVAGCSEMEVLESCVDATGKAKSCHEEGHSQGKIVQDIGNKCTGSTCPISLRIESVNSSVPQESVLNITNKKENQTRQSLIAVTESYEMGILESHVETTEKSLTFGNLWSRRGKAASAPQVRTRKSRFMRTSTSNVDTGVEMGNEKDIINKSMAKDLYSVLDEEEGIFTPNKENYSPNTLHLCFMRKKGMLEIKHSKSQRSHNSKVSFSPNIYPDESIRAISKKENQAPKVAQERKSQRKPLECHINLAQEQDIMELKKNKVEREPFQSLMKSGGKRKSGTSGPVSAAKSINASNHGQISDKGTKPSHISGERKRSWVMVVDTASLLNKESRKALQLLQGLKGTRLIIPRLVIRKLDSLKQQQFRIFSRISQASLALEWIEECMENTKWWIHIQSSMEEHRLIAPTPPASPQTQFVEESWDFAGPKSSKEIALPTVEDHILDSALLYRRKGNAGRVVLLSDDVTLKIKSMAEGLLCETVLEFRHGLVNPFSERFMWANSSPRGLTWSCHDDVVLREKYCGLPSKAGLKLITEQFFFRVVS